MEFNTETKFTIGQKIKAYGRKRRKILCPFCQGNYEREIEGDKFYCGNCDEGIMSLDEESVLVAATVTGIVIDVRKCQTEEDDEDVYTYVDETGYKDVQYCIDADEDEDVLIPMVDEKTVMKWNN